MGSELPDLVLQLYWQLREECEGLAGCWGEEIEFRELLAGSLESRRVGPFRTRSHSVVSLPRAFLRGS